MTDHRRAAPRPGAWGGVECTVNHVGDSYHDQLALNGHDRRPGDLDLQHRPVGVDVPPPARRCW